MPTIVHSQTTATDNETTLRQPHLADMACIYRAFSKERGNYLHVSINRNGKIYQKHFPVAAASKTR